MMNKDFVTFSLEEELYAIEVVYVQEVLEVPNITRVPDMPDYVSGVINIRGNIIPVIDLKLKFGKGATELTEDSSVIVTELPEGEELIQMGILVDATNQVLSFEEKNIEPPPPVGGFRNNSVLQGMGKMGERFVIILDIHSILHEVNTDAEESGASDASQPVETLI